MNSPPQIYRDLGLMMRPLAVQINEILREHGIQPLEWIVLVELIQDEALTAADLAQRLTIEKPNVTRILKDLVQAGYVSVEISREDKRKKHLHVTEKGRAIYRQVRVFIDALDKEITAGITEEEQQLFLNIIHRIRQNLIKRVGEKGSEWN
ncbi:MULTISPECIES: MarR family winged helix-turn-helix transcriptional regulator [Paenibacillus]|uniref:MarR family protein n=1 Tax=Paenibacillus barengoltzii J12 TaxID=935846 RepID=A0ABY1LX56_9BACL|nr:MULTISPECIES: MarR family transcriptional regulator [Paenibacillus]MDU0330414.1 MarR family transcriptional regulator [Paenibacillus sp. 3LSP]MEC2344249.1 MarR family transcriptional regulator [Paenibacillus barengoltzii]SMF22741.1 MarR family protein [Paenibacillus barengoltzii J12]SMF28104.1 MarR family protein [Paenibacillus barengoltzii]